MRNARKKQRDLGVFRKALAELQAQVDELDHARAGYYGEILDGETDLFTLIVECVRALSTVRHCAGRPRSSCGQNTSCTIASRRNA